MKLDLLLELFLHPLTASKKFYDEMEQKILIAISIAIPLLIAIIPSFIIMEKVKAILSPLLSLGSLFSSSLGSASSSITSSVASYIFKFLFQRFLWLIIIATALTFVLLLLVNKVKKLNKSPQELWKAQAVASVQIFYYLIISIILSFLSNYLLLIFLVGIANSILCLYTLLTNETVETSNSTEYIKPETVEPTSQSTTIETVNTTTENITSDPVSLEKTVNQEPPAEVQPLSVSIKLKPLTKKQKVTLASALSVIAVLLALFFLGNFLTGKGRISDNLSEAIKNNNAKAMSKYITSSDSRLKINEESLKGYLSYLKDNPSYTSKLLSSIDNQGKGQTSSQYISLTKSGKKFLIFDNYVYKLPAYFIKIQTVYKNTEVKINDKTQYTSSTDDFSKECGPFLPGKYTLKGTLTTNYATVNGSTNIILDPSSASSNVFETNLKLEGKKVSLYSNYADAKVLINGKDTGITVDKIDDLVPLPSDGSCKIQLENTFPWGTMKSNEQAIDSKSLKLSFSENNTSLMDSIKPSIAEFLNSYIAAYTGLDSSKFTNVSENYKQSLDSNISFDKSYGKPFTGSIASVTADPSSLNLNYNSYSKKEYTVDLDLSIKGDFTNGTDPYFKSSGYNLYLSYDEDAKKWVVTSFGSSWLDGEIKNGVDIKLK